MKKYKYHCFLIRNRLHPISPICLTAERDNEFETDLSKFIIDKDWSMPVNFIPAEEMIPTPLPERILISYANVIEKTIYDLEENFDDDVTGRLWDQTDPETGMQLFNQITIGIAPYGRTACWFGGEKKSVLLFWSGPQEEMKDTTGFCETYLRIDNAARENFLKNGYPEKEIYDRYMKQYYYKYSVVFNGEVTGTTQKIDFIEDELYDGTHDKLHDGSLLTKHRGGIPKKTHVEWHSEKKRYSLNIWFDDTIVSDVFNKLEETKTEINITINIDNGDYRITLDDPEDGKKIDIPEEAYQILVFKNDFECYRSSNFNQEKGSWMW